MDNLLPVVDSYTSSFNNELGLVVFSSDIDDWCIGYTKEEIKALCSNDNGAEMLESDLHRRHQELVDENSRNIEIRRPQIIHDIEVSFEVEK